jgi:hypothetical protein
MTVESEAKQIEDLMAVYKAEVEKFTTSGVRAAGARARKALAEIAKLSKANRKSITEQVNKNKGSSGGCCGTQAVAGGKRKSNKKSQK